MIRLIPSLAFLLALVPAYSQDGLIRGTVTAEDSAPLGFATIFVKELNDGTNTNAEGRFEYSLPQGTYTVFIQYVGYETRTETVVVGPAPVNLNVVMKTQTLVLRDVTITAGKEDPAYTIMRKAIAKAKYHTQQLDHYTAEVYIKGTGKLKNAPFFLRRTLAKEGVELNRVFIQESISEIEYQRPNIYKERVVSIRTSGETDDSASPNAYINGSFYEPELANSISPLSPRAFSYYRFEYDGTFSEGGYEISRIKVYPRSRGDNVFAGYIQIIEDIWAIHSLRLETTKLGITFDIRQQYAPIDPNAWLPVTHDFFITGKVLGFDFEGNYLASVSNYDITLNPELEVELTVVDTKVEEDLAARLKEEVKDDKLLTAQERLSEGGEVTNKELRKLLREYEKAERELQEDPDLISNRTYEVDSLARNYDSLFWQDRRPVPLTLEEVIGYEKTDSLVEVQRMEAEGDTLTTKKRRKGFQPWDVLIGDTYRFEKSWKLSIDHIMANYNTVDGFDIVTGMEATKNFENLSWLSVHPSVRYTFSREAWNYRLFTQYGFGKRSRRNDISLDAGRYIRQFNAEEPIHPIVNTIFSLLGEQNYMKIYEHDYLKLGYRKRWEKVTLNANFTYADRRSLQNTTDYKFFEGKGYTQNNPENAILDSTDFPNHQASTAGIRLEWRPWLKFRMYNGERYPVDRSSPVLSLVYNTGIDGILGSDVSFNQLELGFRHDFKVGVSGFLNVAAQAGTFIGDAPQYLMDFKHFPGNQTPFITVDPVINFRLLDYYLYSTNGSYAAVYAQYQFRKFLLTRFPKVRLIGIREGFFVNYLGNEVSDHYTELGYGVNYIFRILRIEGVTSFQDGKYRDWGIRIGISTNLDDIF